MKSTPRFIKTLSSILALLLAILPLAACGEKEEVQEATPTPTIAPTPTGEPQPAAGGELIIPITRNPFRSDTAEGADPLVINTEEIRNLYNLVYEPLLRTDANNRLIPGLAEKWEVDDTGKVWTFTLRQNVVWHADGSLFDAGDVVYTLDRLLAMGENSYYSLAYKEIETYVRVDDGTLRITMKNAGTAALYALSFPIVCADDTSGVLNGTGAYMVASATDTAVELQANPRWWRQAPYISTVRALARENNDVALDSLEAGQLNFVPTSIVSAGKYREEGITNVLDIMTQGMEVILVNHNSALLRSLDIRQAVACAIDRAQIVSNIYMNRLAVSDVPVPPDSFLYDATSKVYDYDTGRAATLLKNAGWEEKDEEGILVKDGRQLTLRLLVNESTDNTYRKSAAAIIQTQLQAAGILVEVETARYTVGDEENEFEQRLASGNFDLAMVGFNVEASGDLSAYLSSGGVRNYGRYSPSDGMREHMRAAQVAVEEKDMREAHALLQQAFVAELPFIVLGFRMSSIVYSAAIQGISEVRAPNIFRTVRNWYIETTEE